MEKITYTNVLESWAAKHEEVEIWLGKLQRKAANAFDLYRYCEWCGKTPTELLSLKDNPASKEAERLLDVFVNSKLPLKDTVKFRMTVTVKSFFKHSYRHLEPAAGVMQLDKVKPTNKPSKENLRKLWNYALNPRDKSLLTFVCSTAIAKETVSSLQWQHLEENWENVELPCVNVPSKLLKGHGIRKYAGVQQITFLTPEAKRDLKNYREWVEQKMGRKMTAEDNVFRNLCAPFRPIKYYNLGGVIWGLTREAGVKFSWHDARRYVNTALEEIGISENWARKIRGRKVRGEEAPYSQPAVEQLRAKFREAVPLLEFTSETPTISRELEDRVKALESFKADLTPEQLEKAKRAGLLMRKAKNVSAPNDGEKCEDGEHCGEDDFKQIGEAELLQHLKDGWKIAYKLTDGQLIVRRA